MLDNQRSDQGIIDIQEKAFFAGVLIIVSLGALLWYNYIHRPPVFSAESLFTQSFMESPSSVTNLEGDENQNFGFDSWIKFKSPTTIHLRNTQELKPGLAEVGRRWFTEKWKLDPVLHDTASSYEYFESDHRDIGKVLHQWLLINKKQHCYFYRKWGM